MLKELKDLNDSSKKLSLKIDIELTSRLAKLEDLKTVIATIFELNSAALRLVNIEEGCVVATFLIPTPVANFIFNEYTILTKKQEASFQELPVQSLKCNGRLFNLKSRDPGTASIDRDHHKRCQLMVLPKKL